MRLGQPEQAERDLHLAAVDGRGRLLVGSAVLLLLTAPVLGLRSGFPDAGNEPVGSSTRTAYDLIVEAFGAGAPGPLVLVSSDGTAPLTALAAALAERTDVASVGTPVPSADGTAGLLTVIPAS